VLLGSFPVMCLRWSVKVWLEVGLGFHRCSLEPCGSELARDGGLIADHVLGVHIHCCGNGGWRFRPYGDSLFFQTPKKSKQKNACSYVRPTRWGSGFLRSGIHPGGIASGLLRCTSSRCVRLRRTVAALPPRMNPSSQPSDVARGSRSRAAGELPLGLLSGEERAVRLELLWERACSRWRPASRPVSCRCTRSTVGAGLPAKTPRQPTNVSQMHPKRRINQIQNLKQIKTIDEQLRPLYQQAQSL
jgi:hypothetical protein